jgi:hypothetical protein
MLPLVNAGLLVAGVAVAVSGAAATVRGLHGRRVAGRAVEQMRADLAARNSRRATELPGGGR